MLIQNDKRRHDRRRLSKFIVELFHVGIDGLNVFVFVEFVEEFLNLNHLFVGEANGGVGEALQVGFHDVDLALF